jgi:hypothetical protein
MSLFFPYHLFSGVQALLRFGLLACGNWIPHSKKPKRNKAEFSGISAIVRRVSL